MLLGKGFDTFCPLGPVIATELDPTNLDIKTRLNGEADVGRVGGITEWMKVAHLAHAFNLPVAPHAYQLIHLHLGCATPNLKVVEYLGTAEESDKIVYKDWPEPKDGIWSPDPNKPGLGLELDPAAVEKYATGTDIARAQL